MVALMVYGELLIVPSAGHITTLEQAQAVTSALEHWLSRPIERINS